MAQEIQKQLINPVPQGGIPVFADDLLRVQENAKNSVLAFYEGLSRGGFRFFKRDAAGTLTNETTAGLFLNVPTYTEIAQSGNTKTFTISEFFCVLDGEICYFAGGDFDFTTSVTGTNVFAVIKGAPIKDARVFRDGVNNETLVTNTVEIYQVNTTVSGFNSPSQIIGKNAVCLDARYINEDSSNGLFYQNHPNWFLQSSGISETTARSVRNENNLEITDVTPNLQNGTLVTSLRFYRNAQRFIQARGQIEISGAQSSTSLFSLPTGYFKGNRDFDFLNAVSDSGVVWLTRIQGNGTVVLINPNGNPNSFTGKITFDGVSYYEGGF